MKKKMTKKQMKKHNKKIKIYIYQIWFYYTNERYIGQTYDVQERHKPYRLIDSKVKSQTKLYRALKENIGFDQDGKVNGLKYAIVTILQQTTENMANSRQIFWIKQKGTFINGLNSTPGGQRKCFWNTRNCLYNRVVKNIYYLINPNGQRIEINDLFKFCNENNMDKSCLHKVITGKISHYKGWRGNFDYNLGVVFNDREYLLLDTPVQIKDDKGNIFLVSDCRKFQRQNNIPKGNIMNLINKKTKICNKKWSLNNVKTDRKTREIKRKPNKIYRFVNELGQIKKGTVKQICKISGVSKTCILRVVNKKNFQSKGWRLANKQTIGIKYEVYQKNKKIKLLSPDGNIYFDTVKNIAKQFHLSIGQIYRVVCGKVSNHQGWRIFTQKNKNEQFEGTIRKRQKKFIQ